MDNNDVKVLIDAFKEYRDLLSPIEKNLTAFIETYDTMKESLDKLSSAFDGDIKERLESIYKNLNAQTQNASDLSSRIGEFTKMSARYVQDVCQILNLFNKVEERLKAVNEIEGKAEEQIARLDSILEEKSKSYNVRDLQRTLEAYNNNVQKVSEFINKDVAESLTLNQRKLESIKDGLEDVVKKQRNDTTNLEKILESYQSSSELIRKIAEKEDVNEAYIFEILDRWAADRRVKTKK